MINLYLLQQCEEPFRHKTQSAKGRNFVSSYVFYFCKYFDGKYCYRFGEFMLTRYWATISISKTGHLLGALAPNPYIPGPNLMEIHLVRYIRKPRKHLKKQNTSSIRTLVSELKIKTPFLRYSVNVYKYICMGCQNSPKNRKDSWYS